MAAFPWLVSVPMGLAIFASILLAGVPDADADRSVGKRTLVVLVGTRAAVMLAWFSSLATALCIAHALVLLILLGRFSLQDGECC